MLWSNGGAAAVVDRRTFVDLVPDAIYGGILRFARGRKNSLIGKNGNQLFEKIMLKQRDEIVIQLNLVES
jgi:hypothetical protein